MYRIRAVDGRDEATARALSELHRRTFLRKAPIPDFAFGHWWLVLGGEEPVGFAGLVRSTREPKAGYFCRVGVVGEHRGRALQLRLMRVVERRARRCRWTRIVSDTTDNLVSANNFIRAGYRLYRPENPWAWANSLYWYKSLGAADTVRA